MSAANHQHVETEVDGVRYSGWFEVTGRMVRVHSSFGTKYTQVGGTPAEVLAKMLLRELILSGRRRPGT